VGGLRLLITSATKSAFASNCRTMNQYALPVVAVCKAFSPNAENGVRPSIPMASWPASTQILLKQHIHMSQCQLPFVLLSKTKIRGRSFFPSILVYSNVPWASCGT
jgi:hypothetical protein